ncbi:hypothetical protein [Arthrobacter oryzae]|jgi:hypothetical protein|uniref:hypothetical protein n=1 Tax=Arthrobacter oryzae TaxID=409290 RepID=UPI00277D7053|nr:hypothetical protein [Arthrobacter oryzae]MDQ0079076.1 hypothetical protein [Arthrobacter oryzae]
MRQSRRVSMWTSLQRGDVIILCRQGVECYKGSIDERTEDGRTIWVIDQIGDRRLFHVEDDYDLLISGNVYAY